jgi:hypothetical protein
VTLVSDSRIDAGKIDAALREERDRIVVALRSLADQIEKAPLDRLSQGLAWVGTAAEALIRTVERALGGKS